MSARRLYAVPAALVCALMIVNLVSCDDEEIIRRTSNTCKNDIECPDNAFCRLTPNNPGFCSCKVGFIIYPYNTTHRECLKEATDLGDSCKKSVQCHSKLSVNSECHNDICRCKAGSHFDAGRCYTTSLIGQKCQVTQNCYLGPDDVTANQAFCVRGLCQCNFLHSPRDGGTRCLKDAVLGEPCEDDEHCSGENTRCHNVCRCQDDHVVHPSEDRCLKVAISMFDPCEVDAQCSFKFNGTVCSEGKCLCQWDHHIMGGLCWRTRAMGQKCLHSQECLMEGGERGQCVDNSCTCQGCPSTSGSSGIVPKIISLFLPLLLLLGFAMNRIIVL